MKCQPLSRFALNEPAATRLSPIAILRIEGASLFAGSLIVFHSISSPWALFLGLFLTPDLAMLGYLKGNKIGATLYNLTHTTTIYLGLAALAWFTKSPTLLAVAITGLAHIGFDRALGYGLKLDSGFKHTHLGQLGSSEQN